MTSKDPDANKQMADFYYGAHVFEVIIAWAEAITTRDKLLEQLASFERAFEHLAALHAAGKLDAGMADFSMENVDRVKRIGQLLKPLLDTCPASQDVREIHDLAKTCHQALSRR